MTAIGPLLLKNAAANVVRGMATSAIALLLPHFLINSLDKDRFSAWSLILQIAAYAGFLDFGLQTAVARFLAQTGEDVPHEHRNELVSTALAILSGAATLAFAIILLVVWQAPRIFPAIPSSLMHEFRAACICIGVGACLLLPLSAYTGVLIGLHRNEYPGGLIAASRILGALAVLVAARHTRSLFVLALCVVLANLLGGVAQVYAVKRILPSLRVALISVRRSTARELIRYCIGLTVWAFGMLLVSGLDLTLVGHFNFSATGTYSIASILTTLFAGLGQSIISALMTPLTALHARGRAGEIRSLVLRVTRLNTCGNLALVCACITLGRPLLQLWVGPQYTHSAYPILCLLVISQAVRLTFNPYAVTLIAIGRQGKGMLAGIVESLTNLSVSILGAIWFGAIGVAWGTLAGALAGVLATLLYTAPLTSKYLAVQSKDLIREGMTGPLITLSPMLASAAASLLFHRSLLFLDLLGLALSAFIAVMHDQREPSLRDREGSRPRQCRA